MIEVLDSTAIPKSIQDIRQKCIEDREIINGILQKNYLFNRPSYAAAFVLEMNTNGRTDWKDINGITLKELEEIERERAQIT